MAWGEPTKLDPNQDYWEAKAEELRDLRRQAELEAADWQARAEAAERQARETAHELCKITLLWDKTLPEMARDVVARAEAAERDKEENTRVLLAELRDKNDTLAAVRELAATWTKAEHPDGFIGDLLAILDGEKELMARSWEEHIK